MDIYDLIAMPIYVNIFFSECVAAGGNISSS